MVFGCDVKKLLVGAALVAAFPAAAMDKPKFMVTVRDYQEATEKEPAKAQVDIMNLNASFSQPPFSSAKQLAEKYLSLEKETQELVMEAVIVKGCQDKQALELKTNESKSLVAQMRKQNIKNCVVTGVVAAAVGAGIACVCETNYIKTAARNVYYWLKGSQKK